MSHPYDHATAGEALLIYNMVRNRLPSIVDNPTNQALLSNFTWELMNQLEVCFRIATQGGTTDADNTRIGKEENYSAIQQSIIADLVAVYVLVMNVGLSTSGSNSTANGTFLSKAKAGSVEVEYDQLEGSKVNGSVMGNENLLNFYKRSAINKAGQLGCVIEICDDCSLKISTQNIDMAMPFIVVGGCDGCGS